MTNVLNVLTTMALARDLAIAFTSTRWEPFGRETHHPIALQNRPDVRMKDEENGLYRARDIRDRYSRRIVRLIMFPAETTLRNSITPYFWSR